ncbi:odorant receptor 13a-like [Diachasma alloeum]|uniref:Odorant receptor n=1 Tax=Diachasma alloeum TaxID=454923 RepID=A0A4E0RNC4_9HYME|nr:odorant receptor 13a-like [Diachasma alloeum]THK32906.1 odorant receptor 166 [Diachasma alloeum]
MDFFDNPNWFFTKWLLSSFGAWPFQSSRFRYLSRYTVGFLICSLLVPEIIKLVTVYDDLGKTIACVPILALHSLTVTKMLNCLLNLNQNKLLLLEIQKDWQRTLSPADVEILKRNAKQNRSITHTYIYYIYATTLMYLLGPMVPKVLDVVMPLNESRPALEIYQTEYFVDPVKNKIPILVHAYVISPFPSTIIVAFDALYCNCVNHACSMFEIVGKRLENIIDDIDNANQRFSPIMENNIHSSLRACIRQHRKSLQFAHLLRLTYSICFLSIVVINTVALSITLYQVVQNLGETSEIIRYGTFSIGQIVHLFFLSRPAQKLMDHSSRIHSFAYQGYWYNIPMRSKKMLILIMMRSRNPSILTAGKLYVMSLQSFARVIKTSMSYFTVLLSVR